MSDQDVLAALDDLQRLLSGAPEALAPEAVADWHGRFRAAVAGAERGPLWASVQARARELGALLDQRQDQLRTARDSVRHELEHAGQARRALKAYRNA